MALSASEVYHLTVDKLRLVCSERGLDSSGPVLLLRRLADYVKSSQMDSVPDQEAAQASVQTSVMNNVVESVPPTLGLGSHGSSEGCQTPVVMELLRQFSPLLSAILTLFVRLDEIFDLGMVNDRIFNTRILPLVSGNLLRFMVDCLRKGNS
jgi:hypothetical protein